MLDLKIRIFKGGLPEPATTITVPGSVLKIASKLIPQKAMGTLNEKGIDLNEIINIAENTDVHGTLIEIEEHEKDERIVIALE
ncbi:hypothetical protein PGH07_01775 [Sulfurovum sp. zt1-1]|uniref:Uncharacterized protein n=1 Tax=Sulfurovum zhangzhouensis TaxID=3019067 RepID=A0ABT7QVN0_9BACT|nr:hypothetical protein [Sulfurovum zhangzhouensis]MDM5270902.1 hypothetical protein [Sulfurovum zhangzhouensis]